MLENFIFAKEKELFVEQLEAGNIMNEAIVFIEDTCEIWNHGVYFGGMNGPGFSDLCTTDSVRDMINASITQQLNTEV